MELQIAIPAGCTFQGGYYGTCFANHCISNFFKQPLTLSEDEKPLHHLTLKLFEAQAPKKLTTQDVQKPSICSSYQWMALKSTWIIFSYFEDRQTYVIYRFNN